MIEDGVTLLRVRHPPPDIAFGNIGEYGVVMMKSINVYNAHSIHAIDGVSDINSGAID